MSVVLAIDQGTTRTTAAVVDPEGRILAEASSDVRSYWPRPGWVEQDPIEVWEGVVHAVRGALRGAGERPSGIALTGQRESSLLWNGAGEPCSPIIVWQDRRTTPYVEELRRRGVEKRVHELTGLVLDPYFSAPLLHWLMLHVAERQPASLHFGNPVSWVLFRLTGRHAIDSSNAARTLLLDLRTRRWCDELLRVFEIPAEVLPPIVDCFGEIGTVSGLLELDNLPIVAMVGDMQAGLIAVGGACEGVCKVTYGTAGNVGLSLGANPRLGKTVPVTVEYAAGDDVCYCAEANVFVVGGALEWLKRVGVLSALEDIDSLAQPLPEESQLTIVPAFAGLAAPFWEPQTRASVFGLDLSVTGGQLVSGMLEGICLRVDQCLEAFRDELGESVAQLRVEGGLTRSDVLMQLQADLSGVPVERLLLAEGAALGAALLGFVGLGTYEVRDLASLPLRYDRFEPKQSSTWREIKKRRFEEAVRHTLQVSLSSAAAEVVEAT